VEDFEGIKRELNEFPPEELVDRWNISESALQRGRLTIWLELVQKGINDHHLDFDCHVDRLFGV